MSLCEHCARAAFHGFPPEGSPEWEVGTVYFWCEQMRDHHLRDRCGYHVKGEPRRFDKRGKEMSCYQKCSADINRAECWRRYFERGGDAE